MVSSRQAAPALGELRSMCYAVASKADIRLGAEIREGVDRQYVMALLSLHNSSFRCGTPCINRKHYLFGSTCIHMHAVTRLLKVGPGGVRTRTFKSRFGSTREVCMALLYRFIRPCL